MNQWRGNVPTDYVSMSVKGKHTEWETLPASLSATRWKACREIWRDETESLTLFKSVLLIRSPVF